MKGVSTCFNREKQNWKVSDSDSETSWKRWRVRTQELNCKLVVSSKTRDSPPELRFSRHQKLESNQGLFSTSCCSSYSWFIVIPSLFSSSMFWFFLIIYVQVVQWLCGVCCACCRIYRSSCGKLPVLHHWAKRCQGTAFVNKPLGNNAMWLLLIHFVDFWRNILGVRILLSKGIMHHWWFLFFASTPMIEFPACAPVAIWMLAICQCFQVGVPDARLDRLAELCASQRTARGSAGHWSHSTKRTAVALHMAMGRY